VNAEAWRVVWDPLLRVLHWTLVLSVSAAWMTTLWWSGWHQAAGYLAAGAVGTRIVWGFVGPLEARFAHFVRGPRVTLRYVSMLRAGRAPRSLGHNPLGAWMALALMATTLALALTGWLYTTDRFWGEVWLDWLHQTLAWALLVLAAWHVAGVIFTGRRYGENLVAAMFSGRKRVDVGVDMDADKHASR
jgi:cytochrome b